MPVRGRGRRALPPCLPRRPRESGIECRMSSPSDYGYTLRPSRRELVLVMANDDRARSALVQRLQEDGYSVIPVGSGEEAGALLGVTRVDVMVIALAAHRLGTFKVTREVPAVFLGGLVDEPAPDAATWDAKQFAAQVGTSRFAVARDVDDLTSAMTRLLCGAG